MGLPNTRTVSAVGPTVPSDVSKQQNKDQFAAHFTNGDALGNSAVITFASVRSVSILTTVDVARTDESVEEAVKQVEMIERRFGVQEIPVWLISINRSGLV
jgi:hypothetical protein